MKKILKGLGVVLILGILFLALAPFLFKGSLEDLLKKNINENLNASVEWESFDLSLFRSFPDAALTVHNFSVVNKAPFEGDTLASGKLLKLDMGITQLFKSEKETISVNELFLDQPIINIAINADGEANYDITIPKENEEPTKSDDNSSQDSGFSFDLKKYELQNAELNYLDETSATYFQLSNLNHEGTGDFSLDESELQTQTNAIVSLRLDKTEYMHENIIDLGANFQLDLKNKKYTFLENTAKINALPLTFDGFIQLSEEYTELDLNFKTSSSEFKNFLALIPKEYVKELNGVTTTGNFTVNGVLNGKIDDNTIPKMDIQVRSDNASFKYADLPKAVNNISIQADLKNETGLVQDTYLSVGGLTFKIDDEIFTASGLIKNLSQNALVDLAIKGTLDLANIERVLPVELDQDLSGVFTADVTTHFDLASMELEQYQNIETNGSASLSNFAYNHPAFKNELKITKADILMSPGNIRLNHLDASTGQTDVKATGDIQNLIPWIMAKQDLKGTFNIESKVFNVNDFMVSEDDAVGNESNTTEDSTNDETVKIPDFLDATMYFTAKKVLYDNIEMKNTSGLIKIREEKAVLSDVSSQIFGGNINFSGNVDTKNEIPSFKMNLDLKEVDIDQSFGSLDLLAYLAPIAKALNGNINTVIDLEGQLNRDLTPNLNTIVGKAIANILSAEINTKNTPLLAKLGEQVTFLDVDKISLHNISTALSFKDGKIAIQPFDFMVEDVKITAQGSHSLEKNIDYGLTLDVPAKYLGSEITNLLVKLDPQETENMKVSLPVSIKGSFLNPQVSLDTGNAVKNLTNQIIEKQKQQLKDKGTDILKDLVLGKNKPKDSTNTGGGNTTQETTTEVVKDILGGLFGKKKKKQDTTKSGND